MAGDVKLTLALNGEYFDQIAAATKTEEFRLRTDYWDRRLKGRSYDTIELTRGYPKAGDMSRRLLRKWTGYRVANILHPHFGDQPVSVYAIDVSQPALRSQP